MAIYLNQKFINIEDSTVISKSDSKFCFESGDVFLNYLGLVVTPGDNQYIIPYSSLVFVKNIKKYWTHGQWYDGNDIPPIPQVGANSLSFTVNGVLYTLTKTGNDFEITSFTAPVLTLSFVSTNTTGSNSEGWYDGNEYTSTKTATPANTINYKLALGSVSSITITKVEITKDGVTTTLTDSTYCKTLSANKTSNTLLFSFSGTNAADSAVTATATDKVYASDKKDTKKLSIKVYYSDPTGGSYTATASLASTSITAKVSRSKAILSVSGTKDMSLSSDNLVNTPEYKPNTVPSEVIITCGSSDHWLGFPATWGTPRFDNKLGTDNVWNGNHKEVTIHGIVYNCYWHGSSGENFTWTITFTDQISY